MPELPDVTIYVDALRARILNAPLLGVRLASPFVLRSVAPPLRAAAGRTVSGVRRLGKRIVIALEPRTLRPAVSFLRHARAAHRPRRE